MKSKLSAIEERGMKFLVARTHRRNHISQLKDCADYCITKEGTCIMRCPIDGTLAYLDARNTVLKRSPLSIAGSFCFPCGSGDMHAFRCQNGKLQSSVYIGPDRFPVEGFDEK